MSCGTTTEDLRAELLELEEYYELIKAAYRAALTGDHESYRKAFPGGSSQRLDRRKLKDIRQEMEWIRAEIGRITRLLNGCSNPALNLRRRW